MLAKLRHRESVFVCPVMLVDVHNDGLSVKMYIALRGQTAPCEVQTNPSFF